MTRRKFLRTAGAVFAGFTLLGAGGIAYAARIEPGWVEVVNQDLALPRLGAGFSGFRLVQFSDIHLSPAMPAEKVAAACQMVLEQKPDLVAITGDFVDDRVTRRNALGDLRDVLRELSSQVPVTAVLGNRDYHNGATPIRAMLVDAGITELRNKVLPLERGGDRLYIAGVDDILNFTADLPEVIRQIPQGSPAILLAHEPDFADSSAETGRFDLQISGHSHAGQVVFPLVGPLVLPKLGQKYVAGLYQVGSMFQYTNRGLGTTEPHVRFNCRPEITVFTFQPGRA